MATLKVLPHRQALAAQRSPLDVSGGPESIVHAVQPMLPLFRLHAPDQTLHERLC